MPRVDAPYPGSLATVMSKSGAIPSTSPSRLPSYRNHTVRYHPYSAAARPRREDLQWQPVDASNAQDAQTGGLQLTFEVPEAVRLGVTAACQPVSNGDVSGSELDSPIVDGELVLEHKEAETQPKTAEEAADHRRRRGPGTKLVVAFMASPRPLQPSSPCWGLSRLTSVRASLPCRI
ncbi:hypothetical protein C8Q80DRAFT_560762 [Daedaleopsis nitida]|nr:hypothetical protein C8Q80DRAFT_560762 [Daedaleopsis nitida]